jgi:hypothetical protein
MQKQQIGPYDQKNNMFKTKRYNLERRHAREKAVFNENEKGK